MHVQIKLCDSVALKHGGVLHKLYAGPPFREQLLEFFTLHFREQGAFVGVESGCVGENVTALKDKIKVRVLGDSDFPDRGRDYSVKQIVPVDRAVGFSKNKAHSFRVRLDKSRSFSAL